MSVRPIDKSSPRPRAQGSVGAGAAAGVSGEVSAGLSGSATAKLDAKGPAAKQRVDGKTVSEARKRFASQLPPGFHPAAIGVGTGPALAPSPETLDEARDRIADVATKARDVVTSAAESLKDRIVGKAEELRRDVEIGARETSVEQIRDLQPGDKITVGGSSEVSGKIYRVIDGVGESEIKKTLEKQADGTYKITVEHGGKVGAEIGDEVSIGSRRGGKIVNEYVVKTAEEAKVIFDEAGTVHGSNPTPGRAKEELRRQAESQQRLNAARTSTEIVLEDSLQVGVDVGPGLGTGIKSDGKAKPSTTMKVEYDESGRPKKIVLKTQAEFESTTMPNLGARSQKGGVTVSPEHGLKTKVTVSREVEIDIPPDMDPSRLVTDPRGVIDELKANGRVKPNKVEIEQVVGDTEKKITLNARDGKDVDVPKLLTELGGSDPLVPRRAPNEVLRDANVESITVDTHEKQGLDVKVGIDIGVGSLEVGGERTLRRKRSTERIEIPA